MARQVILPARWGALYLNETHLAQEVAPRAGVYVNETGLPPITGMLQVTLAAVSLGGAGTLASFGALSLSLADFTLAGVITYVWSMVATSSDTWTDATTSSDTWTTVSREV